ncbi:hypothetical protein BC939DRAFT_262011 [Gamsiella multidivaricata]|uniref:uncharacterized protein n=1 Tax=Gamsiella multidivaricata TaxID=101098 RepID=UPI00221E3C10|nr:uncharacterized protein BC939DRAFT_262011 [Gamsiella multidivaricata]KAI7819489.1 hypothetical protein BC939DRAFT_262011 [Gamsiella multidivaricata]
MSNSSSSNSIERTPEIQSPSSPSVRRRSTSHKSSEVVTADELRPDWNRRILAAAQRQPGSRRASTSSTMNATFALGRRLAVGRQGTTSRRSNSSAAAADYNGYLTVMRNMGTDLEELMIMEAMRQSLQDEHDRLAREAAAASATNAGAASGNAAGNANALSPGLGSRSGGTERAQTTITRSPLSSPLAPPSTSFSTPTTAQGGPRGTRARRDGDGHDDSSSSSRSENESGSESDQDRPELLHNRAIRFAAVPIPRPTAVETTGGPKHRPQEEATNSPETV